MPLPQVWRREPGEPTSCRGEQTFSCNHQSSLIQHSQQQAQRSHDLLRRRQRFRQASYALGIKTARPFRVWFQLPREKLQKRNELPSRAWEPGTAPAPFREPRPCCAYPPARPPSLRCRRERSHCSRCVTPGENNCAVTLRYNAAVSVCPCWGPTAALKPKPVAPPSHEGKDTMHPCWPRAESRRKLGDLG